MDNIRVVSGHSIPTPSKVTPWNYIHMRLSFDKIDILDSKPTESDTDKMMKLMKGRNGAIYIKEIGDISKNTKYYSDINGDKTFYFAPDLETPCGVKTTYGTLITTPFFARNRNRNLMAPEDSDENGTSNESGVIEYTLDGSNGEAEGEVGEEVVYGQSDDNTLLDNSMTLDTSDYPNFRKRMYRGRLVKKKNENGEEEKEYYGGACALCYYMENGSDKEDTSNGHSTYLRFRIGKDSGVRGNPGANPEDSDSDLEYYSAGNISVTIYGSGGVKLTCEKNSRTVAFSSVDNEIKPRNCVSPSSDQTVANYVLLYPSYLGICCRNSIGVLRNGKFNENDANSGGVQEIVLNKSTRAKIDPWSDIQIWYDDGNGNSSKPYSDAMKKYLGDNPGCDMEFFPRILHETKNHEYLRLRVGNGNKMYIDEAPDVIFQGCVGKFGMTRVAFYNTISFTLYFKGIYIGSISAYNKDGNGIGGKNNQQFYYLVYPVVHSDRVLNGKYGWHGMNKHGAKCIKAVPVCTSDKYRETIYKATVTLRIGDNVGLRAPIEVLGMELVLVRKEFQFTHANGNGTFKFCNNGSGSWIKAQYTGARELQMQNSYKYLDLITSVNVTTGMDGVSGSMELDGYPIGQGIAVLQQKRNVGELDLGVSGCGSIFSGYGLEMSTNGSEGNYSVSVKLEGVQKKMFDMNLVCAPFWDGDRLEAICLYFEQYMKLKLKMIDHTVHSIAGAKSVSSNLHSTTGTWKAKRTGVGEEVFRVPRSFHWENPAVNFKTGTTCLDALKQLANMTSCFFCVGSDGVGYFYELNDYAYPCFVDNQSLSRAVTFSPSEIISINLAPVYENWYNSIATFGFIRKGVKKSVDETPSLENASPGIQYTNTKDTLFPWSKFHVGVENGFMTKSELIRRHNNVVRYSGAKMSQGTVTVLGNNRVKYVYELIKICGIYYFVTQISHNIDVNRKMWTTSYQITYFKVAGGSYDPWS